MKTYVIGDIHGSYKALLQCIERSGIDKEKDTLITVGDVVDGWHEVKECVEELLTFKNLIPVRGNHDQWFMDWVLTGEDKQLWLQQGGQATMDSYDHDAIIINKHMDKYFNKTKIYHIDSKNRLFVHGGYDWHKPFEDNEPDDFMWDRHMYQTAIQWENFSAIHPTEPRNYFKDFNKIFIGHTTTQHQIGWNHTTGVEPVFASNLINLDTGAGYNGKLTIMDVNSEEYWQSDLLNDLYPGMLNARR